MKIHEYQAVQLFREFGIATAAGVPAFTPEEAVEAARTLPGPVYVVKAQIHSGGRGKAGGVKIAKSLEEVKDYAEKLLGATLVTKQTGPEGKVVQRLFITEGVDIEKEYYVSFAVDGQSAKIVMIASAEGGTEIEEVAEHSPEKFIKEYIDPTIGLRGYQARHAADLLGLKGDEVKQFMSIASGLYKLFLAKDCSLVEINPLAKLKDGRMVAIDAKVNFDDNALFRHKELQELRDLSEEDPKETEAAKYDLNYIPLKGNIGCMVNGAGLAMATMDIIKYYGAEPANFLDCGGGATAEKVAGAFKILLSDPDVKGIMVNIFGGIMKCDVIAQGIVEGSRQVGLNVPLVVRLEGTNAEAGKQILRESGLDITPADSMADAAQKIIGLIKA